MALTPMFYREELGKLFDDLRVFLDSAGNIVFAVTQVDGDGKQALELSGYRLYKKDDDASPHYYGFERADGGWYILRETLIAGDDTYEYVKGNSDVVTNWGNRATSLVYDTFANTF